MLCSNLKHALATLAVAAGLLAAAAPASAATYQHNQSNLEFSIDIGTSESLASDGIGLMPY